MEINDFCIGNLISVKNNWRIKEIVGVDKWGIDIKSECGNVNFIYFNKIRGIKLTEEIIDLIATKNNYLGNYWECDDLIFIQFEYDCFWIGIDTKTITSIEYVHELQNIWKLIKGEKLEINFNNEQ